MTFCATQSRSRSALRATTAAAFVCLMASILSAAEVADKDSTGTLRWKNGDELPGKLVGANEKELQWLSPVLSRPISIDRDYLESIRAPKPAGALSPAGSLRFALANGDTIDGELVGVSEKQFLVKSPRHGQVSMLRAMVSNVSRADHAELVDLTRSGSTRWQSLDRQWNVLPGELTNWKRDEPGQISTSTPGARLYLPVNLPMVCEIELALKWQATPAFTFSYGALAALKRRSGDLQVDTWADELVVQTIAHPDDFEHLLTLDPKAKSLRLRLLWNRETGRLAVYDGTFNLLAVITGSRDVSPRSGLFLENRGADLTVSVLRVGVWDGKKRPNEAGGTDRISTLDGTEYYGQIKRIDSDGMLIVEDSAIGPQRISLAQLAEIQIRGVAPSKIADDSPTVTNLKYYDGSRLHGELLGVQNGMASFKTTFSDEPVQGALEGMRELTLPKSAPGAQPAAPFILAMGDSRLRGTLAPAGSALGWRPAGSSDVIPLAADGQARITRIDQPAAANPADANAPDELSKFVDAIYLNNGDRIPCNVLAVDDQAIRIAPGIGEANSIPRSEIKAIELNSRTTGPVTSFHDARWQILQRQQNAAEVQDRRVLVRGRADLNHPELMKDGGFEFEVEWNRGVQATLNVYLFTVGTTRPASSPRIQIMAQNGQLQLVTIVNGNAQASIFAIGQNGKDETKFGFFTDNGELKVFVDGNQVATAPLPEARPAGRGVSISCTTTSTAMNAQNAAGQLQGIVIFNGQPVRGMLPQANPQVQNPQQKKDYLFALSGIRSGSSAGASRGMSLAAEDKRQFLLVPRSQQNNPPKQALVAQNGDLLRGELIELGRSVAQFRSAMEDVNIPRERLAAIVWLATEEKSPLKAPPRGLSQAVFRNGSIISLVVEKAVDNEIIGRHPLLGSCRLALDAIRELRLGPQEDLKQLLAYSEWTLINAKDPVIPGVGPDGEQGFGTFSPLVGKMADDFTLKMLDGKTFKLSEHKDKVVVLDFWATWCNPCMRSLPEMIEATSGFDPKDFLFIGVNQEETPAVIKACMNSHEWKFAVAMDADGKVSKQFQVDGIPQTFIIGRGGKIERVQLGYNAGSGGDLKKTLESLIKGEEVKAAGEAADDAE